MNNPNSPAQRPQYPPYRAPLKRAVKAARKMERRMARAIENGQLHKAKQIQRSYLSSVDARTSALVDAHRRSAPGSRRPHRELLTLARTLNPRSPSGERMVIFTQRKSDGVGVRLLRSYGPTHKAKQNLVQRAMRPFCRIDPRAFLHRGRDAAVTTLLEMAKGYNWRWLAELDIKNYYPSINRDALARSLPVDRETFDATIVSEGAEWRLSTTRSPCTERPELHVTTALRGLPQGAITSPLVADVYTTRLLADLPQEFTCINYGDNFYVGAATKRELIQKIRTLEEVLHLSSQGRLAIVRKQRCRRVDWGFDCLGYRITIRGGNFEIAPSTKNARKFAACAYLKATETIHSRSSMQFLRLVRSWRNSFRLWSGGDFACAHLIKRINSDDLTRISTTGAAAGYFAGRIRAQLGLALANHT